MSHYSAALAGAGTSQLITAPQVGDSDLKWTSKYAWSATLPKTVQVARRHFFGGAVWRPRREAAEWPEIAPDPLGSKRAIRLDVDVPQALIFVSGIIAESGLPQPSFIIVNPNSTRAHVIYELTIWVREDNPKAMALFHKVRETYRQAFHADLKYVGKFQHNPAFPEWETWGDGRRHNLRELASAVSASLFAPRSAPRHDVVSAMGRNCTLFEALRLEAYRVVDVFRAAQDHRGFAERVGAMAAQINATFARPLAEAEVRSIINSIVRFCWNRYQKSNGARLYSQTRPAYLAAAEARRQRAAEMRSAGLTTAVIAREIGVSRRTVQLWNRPRARARSPDTVDFSHSPKVQVTRQRFSSSS